MKFYGADVGEYLALDENRLSPVAQKATSWLLKSWNCPDDEAAQLLGISLERWSSISSGDFERPFNQEQLIRASFLVSIYHGLQVFSGDTANLWPRLPNTGTIFAGRSPVEFMLEGGLEAMEITRKYTASIGM